MSSTLALIAASTGIILGPLAFLTVISGYCMKTPWLTKLLTLGLLGEYSLCGELHSVLLPELLALIGVIHVLATMEILVDKYGSLDGISRILLEAYRVTAWLLAAITLTVAISHLMLIP